MTLRASNAPAVAIEVIEVSEGKWGRQHNSPARGDLVNVLVSIGDKTSEVSRPVSQADGEVDPGVGGIVVDYGVHGITALVGGVVRVADSPDIDTVGCGVNIAVFQFDGLAIDEEYGTPEFIGPQTATVSRPIWAAMS